MLLKKALLSMFLFCPLVTWGQLLSVTATLTDSDAVVWVNGNCSVELFSPNGQAFYNGTAVPTGPQTCVINGSGILTTSIYNTSTITPTGAMYRFSIGSATSAPASQFLTPITAANQTSNLSALITAPRFNSATAFVYGYADVEALHGAPGNQYFKTTTTAGQRIWSGSAWTSGGGGGGSGCTAIGAAGVLQAASGTAGGCEAVPLTFDGGNTISGSATIISGTLIGAENGNILLTTLDAGGYVGISFNNSQAGATNMGLEANVNPVTDPDLYIQAFVGGSDVFRVNNSTVGSVGTTGFVFNNLPVPSLDSITPTASQAVCIKVVGPPMTLGTCSTVVGAGGACTCN